MGATILARMLRHAELTPDKIIYAQLERGEVLARSCTFTQLRDRVLTIANALSELGYEGERAIILISNPLEFIQCFLACLAADTVAVPVTVTSPKKARIVADIARNAQIRCVLSGQLEQQHLQEAISAELGPIAWHNVDAMHTRVAIAPHRRFGEIAHSRPDRLAFLQYTSGSTGAPKGVMVSHRSLMANELIIGLAQRLHRDSVMVSWLPYYHDMGLIGNLLQALYQGCECILMQPIDFIQKPLRWLRAVSTYGATVSGGPNFSYDLCLKIPVAEREGLDLSTWEVAYNGAEPVSSTTIRRFAESFAPNGLRSSSIFPCYGMAESTLFITGAEQGTGAKVFHLQRDALSIGDAVIVLPPDSPHAVPYVSCGHPNHATSLSIVHPETRRTLPPGHVGEIWVRCTSVASGYYNNPETTRKIFGATVEDAPDRPYLRTGDLGAVIDGHLIVVGRFKDVLIVRGRNFYPQDIEHAAQYAHPALTAGGGAAFQCAAPHDGRVVLVHELTRQGLRRPNLVEVKDAIRAKIIEHCDIAVHEVLLIRPGSLPRTTSGKVRRARCRELFESAEFDEVDIPEPIDRHGIAPDVYQQADTQ